MADLKSRLAARRAQPKGGSRRRSLRAEPRSDRAPPPAVRRRDRTGEPGPAVRARRGCARRNASAPGGRTRDSLVECDGDLVRARLRLAPSDGLLLAHDGEERIRESDYVGGVNNATRTLSTLTIREPVADVLDLGLVVARRRSLPRSTRRMSSPPMSAGGRSRSPGSTPVSTESSSTFGKEAGSSPSATSSST